MFGYVTPCKMELKIKDYEKFKAYYCGLCKAIKVNFGNIPRFALNYDMTFLAILLDSLSKDNCEFDKQRCITHPAKKKLVIINNEALNYAAFCNVTLTYYKLLDNVADDKSLWSKIKSLLLKIHLNNPSINLKQHISFIGGKLQELYNKESSSAEITLDEIAHPFAELTGYILSSYSSADSIKNDLYWLGYNLGRWIYIIDAFDDLKDDIKKKKFNAINKVFNKDKFPYEELCTMVTPRIDFALTACGAQCMDYLEKLPLNKNRELLYNILQLGLMEKIDKGFKRLKA